MPKMLAMICPNQRPSNKLKIKIKQKLYLSDMPPVCFNAILVEASDLTKQVVKQLGFFRSGSSVAQKNLRWIKTIQGNRKQ